MNFPFGTNGKFIILGVPILKHIRVFISRLMYSHTLVVNVYSAIVRKTKSMHLLLYHKMM